MNTSVLLIKSNQNNNHSMGTGFVIHQDSFGSYVLTCAHVIEQVVEPTIDGVEVEVRAIGESETIDLALLYMKGLFKTPLELQQKACFNTDVHLIGYSSFTVNQYQGKRREAIILGDKVSLKSVANDNISEALQIIAKDHNEIERGNSGAPLICSESGKVIAVVSNHKGVHEGYAVLIQHLRDIWKEMPPFLFESDDETESPFVGLSAFSIEQAHLFFGRDREIEEILQQLAENNIVMVVGDSGSGKSSVIKAGVLPHYLNGALETESDSSFYCIDMRPANDPFLELSTNISEIAQEFHLDFNSINQIKKAIKSKQYEDIVNALEYIYQEKEVHLLLYIDQFEELFTLCNEQIQHKFIDFLLYLLNDVNSYLQIKIVLTVRQDYYNLISSFEAFYQLTQANRYRLRYMNKAQIQECIEKPLEKTFIDKENIQPFMQAILRDMGDRSNELALLQIALTQTWEHRKEYDSDLLQTYHAIGEVSGALPRLAQNTWEVLTPQEQQLFKYIFIRVVQSGQTGCATRRLARQEEFAKEAWILAQKLASVLDERGDFANTHHAKLGRLLKIRGEKNKSVELVHEALVTQWPMYQRWLSEVTIDNLKHVHDRIIEKLFTYQAHQEKKKFLLLGYELDESMKLLSGGYKAYLSDQEVAYIETSCQQEKRSRYIKRLLKYGLIVLTIESVLLSALFYQQKEKSEEQTEELERRIEEIRHNYIQQGLFYRDEEGHPSKAKLFFIKLFSLPSKASQTKVSKVLYHSVTTDVSLSRMFEHDKVMTNIALNPNEDKLLSWSHDASLRLWDLESGEELFKGKHNDIVWNAELSHNEQQIVSCGKDGKVKLWDVFTKHERFRWEHKEVWRAKFSSDQQQIISWSANQTKVWDCTTGELLREIKHRRPLHAKHYDVQRSYFLVKNNTLIDLISVDTNSSLKSFENNTPIKNAKFSHDKNEVMMWDDNITVSILDNTQDNFERLHRIPLANEIAGIMEIGLSPNKQELFIWGVAKEASRGLLLVWDLVKQKRSYRYEHPMYPNQFSGAMFVDNGARLLCWNEDTVQLWDKQSNTPEEMLTHSGVVRGIRVSRDYRHIFSYGESGIIYQWERTGRNTSPLLNDEVLDARFDRVVWSDDEQSQLHWDRRSNDNKVRLIDATGTIKTLEHRGKIYGAKFV
ncbi:MAG TPA: hypothetical protein ENK86_00785, partial [Campylobacterales bacterium]|nr:hypothetical protein [Campylobacterales bacterium]